jgi:hypothetical protein
VRQRASTGYVLADGSKSRSLTFRIRSLKVGDQVIENVAGSVAPSGGCLYLANRFSRGLRLGRWIIRGRSWFLNHGSPANQESLAVKIRVRNSGAFAVCARRKIAIATLGLSQVAAARLLGVDERTSRRWACGGRDFPGPAARWDSAQSATPSRGAIVRHIRPTAFFKDQTATSPYVMRSNPCQQRWAPR